MPFRVQKLLLASIASIGVAALAGCTTVEPDREIDASVVTVQPEAGVTVVSDADAVARSIEASRVLFASAPAVVVAPVRDAAAVLLSAQAAVGLGVPLLLAPSASGTETGTATATPAAPTAEPVPAGSDTATPDADAGGLATELERLGVGTVVAVGDADLEPLDGVTVVESGVDADELASATGVAVSEVPDASVATVAALRDPVRPAATPSAGPLDPRPTPAKPVPSTIALTTDAPLDAGAAATARAAGVPVTVVPAAAPDPLLSSDTIATLHEADATSTLLLGEAFAELPDPDYSVRAAATSTGLPGGGQHLFDDRLFVALYGAPGAPVLGVLGEQDVAATIERARKVAAPYEGLTDRAVVPTLEVIATVAAGDAGDDGDYSNELPPERLEPYIDAAADAGMYVVLDLQPGRTDFLTQAKLYEDLLARPNVGLALDPEWRLAPNEKHLTQIGSVTADEVDSVSKWLADLVDSRSLPPKMLVLHQFRLDMIEDRQELDLSHPQLELLVHADGQGGQPDKQATWRALHADAPAGMAWGWKNFYDEDLPMLTPEQTLRDVDPEPDLVTYQ